MNERSVRILLAAASLTGLMISAYLTWSYFEGTAPVCFVGQSGCEALKSSPYSAIFGIPLIAHNPDLTLTRERARRETNNRTGAK
jgi:uncharacterized membrane protein